MKGYRDFREFSVLVGLFLVLSLSFIAQAEEILTPHTYYRLTIGLDMNTVNDLSERIDLLNQNKGDFEVFLTKEKEAIEKNGEARQEIFNDFGVTPSEYGRFKRTHREELDLYLGEHPEVKEQIDNLLAQMVELVDSYEALKESAQGK